MLRLLLSASLTISFCLAAWAQSPSPTPPSKSTPSPAPTAVPTPTATPILDALTSADLEKAIPLIRQHYLNPAALDPTELERDTLAGVLDRLSRGVALLPARPSATPTPAPFYREIIAGHIGYLRPGDLSAPQLQELDTTLRGFSGKKVDAVILDLRGSVQTSDFDLAAQFAKRFVAKGKTLFSLRGAGKAEETFTNEQAPLYDGLVVLLADEETAGAPEVLAAVLKNEDNAIIVGETTAGCAVKYADLPLPSGQLLRVAVAEAILPGATPRFPDGVPPDLPVRLPIASKRQIFQESLSKGMAPFVFESERPHFNEAALIAGTNPEIEAGQQRRQHDGKAALHDTVLQRGVDLVTSIEVYQQQAGRSP